MIDKYIKQNNIHESMYMYGITSECSDDVNHMDYNYVSANISCEFIDSKCMLKILIMYYL